jgi:hypothetical protein
MADSPADRAAMRPKVLTGFFDTLQELLEVYITPEERCRS